MKVASPGISARKPPVIPDHATGMFLAARAPRSIVQELLSHPTLPHHFEGVSVEAEYLLRADRIALEKEAGAVKRAGCRLLVDFSALLNFYPGLTLIDNIPSRWERSRADIASVLEKASLFGCRDAILSLHRNAENHVTAEEAEAMFRRNVAEVAGMAASLGMTLHLANNPWRRFRRTMRETIEFVKAVNASNLRPALNTCHCIASGEDPLAFIDQASLVLASAPERDPYGQFADVHAPIVGSPWRDTIQVAIREARGRGVLVCLDALYDGWDAVYRDLRALDLSAATG